MILRYFTNFEFRSVLALRIARDKKVFHSEERLGLRIRDEQKNFEEAIVRVEEGPIS